MTAISIEAALGSGFGLIRRRPRAVLCWGLVQIAFAAAPLALPSFFSQSPAVFVPRLAPLLTLLAALAVPLVGCAMAILGAPSARAYRDLAAPAGDGAIP